MIGLLGYLGLGFVVCVGVGLLGFACGLYLLGMWVVFGLRVLF